ncbi:hypothetical protein [Moorena sp. SIO4G3]|uniref:hypothetical protein n=1 Tax=Moorena sp. SIO4G3 TaxID=2607821 RepID=UPI00142ADDD1|nr:hypothetical protein [Moorena sp. SIO4G3]NEO81201.1 hypothetical protein [Moorena sp. SIO4G3]
MEWAYWWNGHLVVERASCCGTGILLWNGHLVVERASCCGTGILLWNGHLVVERASCCGTGILPVTIPEQAGCPPHSY